MSRQVRKILGEFVVELSSSIIQVSVPKSSRNRLYCPEIILTLRIIALNVSRELFPNWKEPKHLPFYELILLQNILPFF